VTCAPATTVYTGAAQELCATTVTGVGGLSLTPAPTYMDNTDVGTATASYSYAGDANHDVSDDSATFAITKASSTTTVTCSPVTTVYTGAAQELCAATVTGVGGLSLTPTPVYTDNTNVGTATASYSYAGDANHEASTNSASFAISAAALSVTANSYTRSHLAADPVLTGTLIGVLGADGITATYSSPGTGSQVAGVYPTIPTLVDPSNKVGNYAVTSANGTLTIVNANVAPVCSLTPSISSIWPVNQQMVSVTASGATDANGGPLTYRVVSSFQDESTSGTVDGSGIGTSTAQVRAERDGSGNGRVYHITFSVTDNTGLSCQATVKVRVPHSPNGPAVDGGPLHDSTVATAKSEKSKKSKKSGKSDKSSKDNKSDKSGNSPKSGGKSDKSPAPKAATPKGKK
jgi:MBG domain (YGX type)